MPKKIIARIEVLGGASQSLYKMVEVYQDDLDLTLMEFLRLKGVPVASSCFGEGVCRKCVVRSGESELLSCLISVNSFLAEHNPIITISYI